MWRGVGILLSVFAVALSWASFARAETISLYSESTVRSRTQDAFHETSLNFKPLQTPAWLEVYAGARLSEGMDLRTTDGLGGGFLALYPGARLHAPWSPNFPLTAFAEYWALFQNSPPQPDARSNEDLRAGFYAYHWEDLKLSRLPIPGLFSETYGEGVYSTRLENNIFFAGWTKVGRRFALTPSVAPGIALDPFLELFAKRDRLGYSQENLQEFRPGLRLAFFWEHLSASLSATHAWGSTSSTSQARSESYREWKGLLALSGGL
jgi:hypothetical protein